ncbi:MAG: universal stress protein [Bacteroidia bacterium]|nr:universal stress protein [Bacteroidia bacterium]
MKTIVCPVDFSETAEKAAHYAARIARELDAELILAHAQHVPSVDAQGTIMAVKDLVEEQQAVVSKDLDALVSRLNSSIGGAIKTWQTFGLVVDMINEMLEQKSIYMVIMGTKGATNAIDRWIGTTSTDVMNRCDVPMIIVPEGSEFVGWKRVGYATDFSQETDNGILDVQELIKPFGATLSIVHVSNKTVDADEMMAVVRHFEPEVNVDTITGSDVALELNDYVWSNDLQLLALKRHKRNFFERLFHKSVAQEIAISSQMPILVL